VNVWENSKLKKNENTAKVHDHALDAVHMDQSSDVTIYIYVGNVLEKQRRN
jgi:methionine salvage enolase-phosphatase E1